LGITAYRTAFEQRRAILGRQTTSLAGSELWVVPNPNGRNVRISTKALVAAYREAAIAAGISCLSLDPPQNCAVKRRS
jgi:TDG/mug DNA glycosylase family protein